MKMVFKFSAVDSSVNTDDLPLKRQQLKMIITSAVTSWRDRGEKRDIVAHSQPSGITRQFPGECDTARKTVTCWRDLPGKHLVISIPYTWHTDRITSGRGGGEGR